MAPKPFQPPRPTGRPKGSTSAARKSTSNPTISKPKAKPGLKPGSKRNSTSTSTRKTKQPRISIASTIHSPSVNSPPSSQSSRSSSSDPFDDTLAQPTNAKDAHQRQEEAEDSDPFHTRTQHIPPALLARLLHEFFRDENTRIHKDANAAVGRYVETFVREALARAVFIREEMDGSGGMSGGGGGGLLEVEDLERLAPQLLLDF